MACVDGMVRRDDDNGMPWHNGIMACRPGTHQIAYMPLLIARLVFR